MAAASECQQCLKALYACPALSCCCLVPCSSAPCSELAMQICQVPQIHRRNSALQLPSLAAYSALQRLDVSFNQFRSLQSCSSLPGGALTELYAASNKISRIEVRRLNSMPAAVRALGEH